MTAIRRLAHDSGDGQTVLHCPFCGGGQVIGRSDGTIECEFDGTAFTVQVQPLYSGFPQTVNGMPFPIPGMPGQIGGAPMPPGPMDDTGLPPGAEQDGGNPFAEDAADPGQDEGAPPFAQAGQAPDDGQDDAQDDGDAPPPPKGKGKKKSSVLYRTASGARLSESAFARYLAVRHSSVQERAELLERLRTSRRLP
jgi:hypothetical protein